MNGTGQYLDVSPLAFFDGCAPIVCACGLGDVTFAGRHWDGFGWECEMVSMRNGEEEQMEEQASDVFVNSVSITNYCHIRILR